MLLIQVGAILLVVSYYRWPGLQAFCAHVSHAKERGGLPFAVVVGAFAGGIFPEMVKFVTRNRQRPDGWREVGCVSVFFAVMGLSVDIMYGFFGRIYGTGHDPSTILKKTASDMGLFCPFYSVPLTVLIFTWKDVGFSWSKALSLFRQGGYWDRYIKVLLPNWMVWIPVVTAVYCLPLNLQFLTAQLAEAAWSIVAVHISQSANADPLAA